MKLSLLDVLFCPGCGASPLAIEVISEERIEVSGKVPVPVCERYCAATGGPPGPSSPCVECLGREILAAELTCPSCGSRFGVDGGVPLLPPPAGEDFLVGGR